MEMRWNGGDDWAFAAAPRGVRRGTAAAVPQVSLPKQLAAELKRAGVEIALLREVVPRARRGAERPALDFTVDCAPGERTMTILQHPSGATTFHAPLAETQTRRGNGRPAASQRFRIELAEQAPLRRGIISSALKFIVVKVKEAVIDKVVSAGLHAAALGAEGLWWRQRKLAEGWHAIGAAGDGIQLTPARAGDVAGTRTLLFLHGTFSDTVGSFRGLLRPKVLAGLKTRSEGRIFGFEHFSVSRTPEENARMLLEFLPDREQRFDVVSYSRGGLVLRTLAEHAAAFGPAARRFRLGSGVLVAVPNGGTPLATGRRWEETFGLLATLLELVPDSPLTPLTTAAAFIADGLVWLAGHLSGDLPGLASMDADGAVISTLQQRGPGTAPSYSAIGANYHPSTSVWQKLLDAGVDGFFAGANDLVVPTDGALGVDPGTPRVIPAERVACFGPGGNLRVTSGDVHHLSVLDQEETGDFVLHALRGESQRLTALDLSQPRPSRKPWRGGQPAFPRPIATPRGLPPAADQPEIFRPAAERADYALVPEPGDREGDRTLQIMIVSDLAETPGRRGKKHRRAQIIAMYGGARVVEPFELRDEDGAGSAGKRFGKIIGFDTDIQMNLEGRASTRTLTVPELPSDDGLREFGTLLFEALFTARVRRLYDLARAEQRGRPLNVVFTCTIPWVAAKPWEFAFDPNRRKFLATEELHFVRSVLTAVPAQRVGTERKKLRLLVVEAQPAGTADLALEEEERQIRFRFQPLIEAGLVEVDVLAQATPGRLHEMILSRHLEQRPYDVVHFIGHGEFDREASEGRLLFQTADGGAQPVETQTLRELLCNRGLQLVFLNACDTARDANQQLNRGVASALVEGGLPAVVANQYKVLDPSAVAFAQQFYWALANGATLGEAAREARIAVNYSIDGEIIDWAVPVLYARDPDRRFCVRKAAAVLLKPAAPRAIAPPAARAGEPKPLTVGIADLARYFTGLEDILARLNAVQSRFVFRLVDVNTPMGVWEYDAEENMTCLYAEHFAEKLRDRPKALGVDLLGCITNWWMRDDEATGIYGWWSGESKVLIFSTGGLDLPTDGSAAGRVVANELVCAIGAQLMEAASEGNPIHKKGPADCPFFYNDERNIESITNRLKICATSRKLLARHLPADLDPAATLAAFDALLAAYDDRPGDAKKRPRQRPAPRPPRRPKKK